MDRFDLSPSVAVVGNVFVCHTSACFLPDAFTVLSLRLIPTDVGAGFPGPRFSASRVCLLRMNDECIWFLNFDDIAIGAPTSNRIATSMYASSSVGGRALIHIRVYVTLFMQHASCYCSLFAYAHGLDLLTYASVP